jgi:hypothetical protein
METKQSFDKKFVKILLWLLLAVGALFFVMYAFVALSRMAYPFELEWMEGGSVVHVDRILQGKPIYVFPSLEFVPAIYLPFYYYVSAFFALFFGNGFFALRLVSFLSSLGCLAFIFLIVRRRTNLLIPAFIANGLFVATFSISGYWFDLARIDSLFLFTILAGIYTFESKNKTAFLFSPLLIFLAFFTKQTALILAGFMSLVSLISRPRLERIFFPLAFAIFAVLSLSFLETQSGGWEFYYTFLLPSQHSFVKNAFINFFAKDLFLMLVPACFAIYGIFKGEGKKQIIRDMLLLLGLLATAFSARIHEGGFENVLMPAHAGISIYFGIGFAKFMQKYTDKQIYLIFGIILVLSQFLFFTYNPFNHIPSFKDKQQGVILINQIASFKGKVYLSDHPWYSGMLGKQTYGQDMAFLDIFRADDSYDIKKNIRARNGNSYKK